MAKSDTQFGKDYQPGKRGPAKRTLILNALKANGKTEDDYWEAVVEKALDGRYQHQHILMKEVNMRLAAPDKSISPLFKFDFPVDGKPKQKYDSITSALSNGEISIEAAKIMTEIVTKSCEIYDLSELMETLDRCKSVIQKFENNAVTTKEIT